jgi:dolichol-phosphate mannosyltransferase
MIYILIPIFNEEANISNLFQEINSLTLDDDYFLVFSDDGSTDQSISLLKNFFAGTNFQILGDGKNYGPGKAFNIGFNWILDHSDNDADIVVTMEADTTSDINILPHLLAINNLGYDLALASVYAQGGTFEKTSWFRKLISSLANLGFRFIFDLKVLTISSFYRAYKITILKDIKSKYNDIIEETGFICMLEVLIKAIKLNAKVIEVPMSLKSSKRVGKSKMKVFKTSLLYIKFMFTKKY